MALPNWCELRRESIGWMGAEALSLTGQAAGMGILQPGEDAASEGLHSSLASAYREVIKETGPGGAWGRMRGTGRH